jgi:pre-mRNA-splicing factor 18
MRTMNVNIIIIIIIRLLEMLAPDINKGLRNDFREAMEQVDQDYLDDMLQQQQVCSCEYY